MVFSSLIFLYLFLPLCLIAYFCVRSLPRKNLILCLFSLLFYAWGEPVYVLLLLASACFHYWVGRCLGSAHISPAGRRFWIFSAVAVNLASLTLFKYAGLLTETFQQLTGLSVPAPNLSLPIGISFYTFQAMSYVIDVSRGSTKSQPSFLKFLTYLSMFPQLIAGPIVRYADIAAQMDSRETTGQDLLYGLLRFSTGLAKKILLADRASIVVSQLLDGNLRSGTVAGTWLGVILFAFQIYFDFSGYSDMAIGLGRIFGFRYLENFNLPYLAASITDFWRRWHISLSSFFRDYVYIPLGGNRRRQTLNLLITWGLTGLWHGASWNFLLWGLYFFLLLIAEKPILKKMKRYPRVLRRTGTMFLVLIGWTIFYFTDFRQLGLALANLFGFAGGGFINTQCRIIWLNSLPLLLACILGSTPIPRITGQAFGLLCASQDPEDGKHCVYVVSVYLFCVALLILSTISLVGSGFSAFLYYRF